MTGAQNQQALLDVIGAAIWRRVTEEDSGDGRTTWDDLWPSDREEFELDAEAVLEDLVANGYLIIPSTGKLAEALRESWPSATTVEAAVDVLARAIAHRLFLAAEGVYLWEDYPLIGEDDWTAVEKRVMERTEADKPDPQVLLDAYEYLAARAEATT